MVQPLPPEPGQSERFDYEYVRNGTANLFMVSEPLLGRRAVRVTKRRTAKDYAEVLRWLAEDVHPDAEVIVLVQDNLNTHTLAALYEAFEPERARRLAERFEVHYTPNGREAEDQDYIGLIFADAKTVKKRAHVLGVTGFNLEIPPHDDHYKIVAENPIHTDQLLLSM